jgi:hypothetical protein
VIIILISDLCAQQVLFIDATGPLRLRSKEPVAFARGGPLQPLSGEAQTVWPELLSITPVGSQQPGKAVFEMKFTNRSRSDLLVPVDPNSADFDRPLTARGASTLDMIEISMVADRPINSCAVSGDLKLLGDHSVPKSLLSLQPGQWIRIKGMVRLNCGTELSGVAPKFEGNQLHAMMSMGKEQITSDKDGLHGAELVQNFMNSNGVVVGNAAGK